MNEVSQHTVLMNTPFRGKQVYFIGIGGIGMSALARYFHTQGAMVSGYDRTSTPLTRELEATGIPIHYEENLDKIARGAELVVYTPAIPREHQELVYYQKNGYQVVKRSDVLQMISQSSFNICIAGTHGKTTITTMIAHLLRDSGYGCNAFLGGISVNYGTNFWSHERNVCVIEADEYDRSFLKLNPDIAVVTAMDADHLDIYGTAEEMEKAFIEFTGKVKPGGLLVSKFGLKRGKDLLTPNKITYSLQNDSADVYATNIQMKNGSYRFDVMMKDNMLSEVDLHMGGMHNVENITAAIAVASSLGIENDLIKKAVAGFKGVKRRFEYIIKTDNQVFIDDYAHHPEELRALITGAKSLFAGKTCTIIFQPHLFSRTKDHADGFAEVLDFADRVVLLPIYPARELPMEGVSSEMVLNRMKNPNRELVKKEALGEWVREYAKTWNKELGNVLITAGAGDIDGELEGIRELLERG